MVRPLEDIHQRGGTRIFMATTAMATIIATMPTILATTIIVTGIATERDFEAALGGLPFFTFIDFAADLRPGSSSK
jgi:hypothetical protein